MARRLETMNRRSFLGAISLGLAAIAAKFKPAPKRVEISEYTAWQQGVLRRNFKGVNTGSALFGLISKLKNEELPNGSFNWFHKS